MKVRKYNQATVIHAVQWFKNGDHPGDYKSDRVLEIDGELVTWTGKQCKEANFEGEIVRRFRHPNIPGNTVCGLCNNPMEMHGWIDDSDTGCTVCPGDYIVPTKRVEYVPWAPKQFHQNFKEC